MFRNKEFQKDIKENLEKINLENTNNDTEIKEIIDALEFVINGGQYVNVIFLLDDARDIFKKTGGYEDTILKLDKALLYYESYLNRFAPFP